ncbi:unnamed protein product [Aphanomyces euteiches]
MRKAILAAKHSILIAGWWVCPDLLLERHDAPNRIPLKELLLQKAQEGVRIHILLYQEVNVAMDLGSYYAMKQLKRHPNIRVLRDPAFQVQSFGFWSHHEKVIVVDFDIAFVGGLDLAFGRYDTCHHSLSDPGHDSMTHLWPGKDYSNPIIKDFVRVNNPNEELIDRNNVPHYVMFFGLRTYGLMPNGRCVTEQIYIHSKVFISDDTTVICGSANINDRSMNGDRDSEIAIVMEDSTFSQGSMNGVPYDQGTLATRLRLQLFQEHLGLADPTPVLDPTTESTWQFLKSRAQANTDVFEQVFRCAPSNMYRSFNCFDTQWHQLDEIYENQRLNPLKGRAAWGPQNLLADGDYAPWTDVNGVPIPIEKINWEEYVVVPDPLFPALSTDDQGWYYARNFKIFQEMRVHSGNHQANIRVRKRDKFQHFMADRLLAQVRRRKYVKLSTLPVLNGEYVDTVPVLRDDDKDTFYAKWRQWASKKLKPPPTSVTEYHEMTESSHHAEESKRSHIPSRHSDSELDFPRQRPVLRLSESDIKAPRREDQVREPPRSWLAALELGLPPMLFRTTHSDRFDSSVGDMDDIHILSPTPSVVSSTLQNDIQLGNVHTNAETQEVSAQATLQAIQGHLVVFPLEFLAEETLKPSILPRSLHI